MELYKIESCKSREGCPRAVGDTNFLIKKIENIFKKNNFTEQRRNQLNTPKQHHVFRIGLAGCANCCSQPQIKDFALVAKALPQIDHDQCTLCGQCLRACREQALTIEEEKLNLNKANCLGCGDCQRVCPKDAIKSGEVTWRLLLGGKLGRHPQLAKEIKDVSPDEALKYLEQSIEIVLNSPNPQERFAQMLTKGKYYL